MNFKRIMAFLAGLLAKYLDDALLLAGGVCILRGLAMWSEMATWIAGGVMLMALAVLIGAKHVNP